MSDFENNNPLEQQNNPPTSQPAEGQPGETQPVQESAQPSAPQQESVYTEKPVPHLTLEPDLPPPPPAPPPPRPRPHRPPLPRLLRRAFPYARAAPGARACLPLFQLSVPAFLWRAPVYPAGAAGCPAIPASPIQPGASAALLSLPAPAVQHPAGRLCPKEPPGSGPAGHYAGRVRRA